MEWKKGKSREQLEKNFCNETLGKWKVEKANMEPTEGFISWGGGEMGEWVFVKW